MRVKASIKLNTANIKKIEQAMAKALPTTLEAMKTEVNNMQVVPKDTGNLEESVVVDTAQDKGNISYSTPYARRLYYHPEYNFRKDKNPNAQGRWLDNFLYGPKKDWLVKAYGQFLKDNAGGVVK